MIILAIKIIITFSQFSKLKSGIKYKKGVLK